ncbi:NAD-dependent DNA ligase LigA, partial [Extibacter sp. GGCC_0201]|nr:NAD-dependent DNA ligase LigA [Extibacter sp. GGCC_0201]
IAPVAVFDTVEIDGCEVSRASLHNLSFIEALEFMPGNRLLVSKHNMIIPHIEENIDRGGFALERIMPRDCPC